MDDWNQFMPSGGQKADPVRPRFYAKPVHMAFASEQAGRPIYEDRDFVEIIVPGARTTSVHEEVTPEHKDRWPREFAAYKQGQDAPATGTPIEQWPLISASKAQELRALNIRTLEDLAQLSDGHLQNLGHGGRELRKQAQVALEAAEKGAAPIARLVAENHALKDEVALLKRQLAEQADTIKSLRASRSQKEAA